MYLCATARATAPTSRGRDSLIARICAPASLLLIVGPRSLSPIARARMWTYLLLLLLFAAGLLSLSPIVRICAPAYLLLFLLFAAGLLSFFYHSSRAFVPLPPPPLVVRAVLTAAASATASWGARARSATPTKAPWLPPRRKRTRPRGAAGRTC